MVEVAYRTVPQYQVEVSITWRHPCQELGVKVCIFHQIEWNVHHRKPHYRKECCPHKVGLEYELNHQWESMLRMKGSLGHRCRVLMQLIT